MNEEKTCCVFGHRRVNHSELEKRVYETAEKLILEEDVSTFLFGSKSEFDDVCYDAITKLKEKYPGIVRVYVRGEFPYIDDKYKCYLLERYEDTYFPQSALKAGKAVYIKRNQDMIERSKFCIVYYEEKYTPPMRKRSKDAISSYQPKSGTKTAYDYAVKKNRVIVNLFEKA